MQHATEMPVMWPVCILLISSFFERYSHNVAVITTYSFFFVISKEIKYIPAYKLICSRLSIIREWIIRFADYLCQLFIHFYQLGKLSFWSIVWIWQLLLNSMMYLDLLILILQYMCVWVGVMRVCGVTAVSYYGRGLTI